MAKFLVIFHFTAQLQVIVIFMSISLFRLLLFVGGWMARQAGRQAGQPERLVSEPPPINLLFSTEGSSRQPIAVNNAWNGLASGQTNRVVNEEQLKSARRRWRQTRTMVLSTVQSSKRH